MSEPTSERDRLLDEAIDLIIRHQNDQSNPVTAEMIRAWRARGPQHEDAWVRVSKVHGASGKILNEKRRIERQERLAPTRRNFMIGGLASLGVGAAAYTFGPNMVLEARADYLTGKGEIRRIDLPDGSAVTLGPVSAIKLDFQPRRRNIDLMAGMAFFEVASDRGRPFRVGCGKFDVTAPGAAFDISSDTSVLSVSVDRGSVEIGTPATGVASSINLPEGEWITIDPSDGSMDRGQRDSGEIASWRNNILIAERDTVSVLVARIGRWLPGRIVIADPYIGRQRISGIFDLNDPLRALRAVVRPTGAHVRQISSFATMITPV